ncbi:MAG: aspartate/glutamate racemase family protein [Alphaproteobacteria bacterium]|nr:aspartate/glutamate racemase family protein [Alphaproteobacteria bacterium]
MKTIGLIGGMSWESTEAYYRILNETIRERLGGLHSAKVLLYSVDFEEIEQYQADGAWNKSADVLGKAAVNLEKAGADFIVICTNTMHKIVPHIQRCLKIPIIHIAEATALELRVKGVFYAGLLGTKYTMTQNFYKAKLSQNGVYVITPNEDEMDFVNYVIYDELCRGIIAPESKLRFLEIIDNLQAKGAQGVILGCTEIGMLISQQDTKVPVFDTTTIHARRAALYAINQY